MEHLRWISLALSFLFLCVACTPLELQDGLMILKDVEQLEEAELTDLSVHVIEPTKE